MIKIYIKMKALKDMPREGWKKDDYCEITNDVFSQQNGIAYYPLDTNWQIIKMEIREYKNIDL